MFACLAWTGLAFLAADADIVVEDEFETEIPDEEAEKITTVQQAVDYINSHSKQ